MCFKSKEIKNPVEAVGVVQSSIRAYRSTRRPRGAGPFNYAQRYVHHFRTLVNVEGLQEPLLGKDIVSYEDFGTEKTLYINGFPMQLNRKHIKYLKEGGMSPPAPYEEGERVLVVYDAKNPKKCRIEGRAEAKKDKKKEERDVF